MISMGTYNSQFVLAKIHEVGAYSQLTRICVKYIRACGVIADDTLFIMILGLIIID